MKNKTQASNNPIVINAAKSALMNKSAINATEYCACYHCQKIMTSKEITEWTDEGNTAICPFCKIDSILPKTPELTQEVLEIIHNYWL